MARRWLVYCAIALLGPAFAQPAPELLERAEKGDTSAQVDLGLAYLHGKGVDKSFPDARKWMRKAAELGDAEAQVYLGHWYEIYFHSAEPMPGDDESAAERYQDEAITWCRKAAGQNDRNGQACLADIFERMGLDHEAESLDWYRKAAAQGMVRARITLGDMYAEGRGTRRDYVESLRWYRLAAESGDALAQFQVGLIFANGRGVPADQDEASKWYGMAAAQGNPLAQAALRRSPGFTVAPCNFSQPSPKGFTVTSSTDVFFDFPPASRAAKIPGPTVADSDTVGSRFFAKNVSVTVYSSRSGRTAPPRDRELILHGGGAAYFDVQANKDGSGSISVVWPEVGRSKYVVELVANYTNSAAQGEACSIVRSAHLMDPLADLSVTRVETAKGHPYAWIRNAYGQERRIYKGDYASRDWGKVEEISNNHVDLIELLPNDTGGWREKLVRLPVGN